MVWYKATAYIIYDLDNWPGSQRFEVVLGNLIAKAFTDSEGRGLSAEDVKIKESWYGLEQCDCGEVPDYDFTVVIDVRDCPKPKQLKSRDAFDKLFKALSKKMAFRSYKIDLHLIEVDPGGAICTKRIVDVPTGKTASVNPYAPTMEQLSFEESIFAKVR